MSMRPRESFEGRIAVAQSRMAPGGRRWSESPIPRPARRRVRGMAGEETTAPIAGFTTQFPTYAYTSGLYDGWSFGSDITFAAAGMVTGLRYHHWETTTTPSTMKVYTPAGTLLATTTMPGSPGGYAWVTTPLGSPLAVTAGQTIRVVIITDKPSASAIPVPPATNGPVAIVSNSYHNSAGGFPIANTGDQIYVDVLFQPA